MTADVNRTYFTWPDGRFAYDCAGCGACCRGLGIGIDAVQGGLAALVSHYPALATFLRNRGGAWTAANPRGACYFLDAQGRCRVERCHGRALKPAACRLFPFNRVFRLGDWRVVDFNSVICPLHALPPATGAPPAPAGAGPAEPGVRHAALLAELATVADPALVGVPAAAGLPASAADAFVARELAVQQACFAAATAAVPDPAAAEDAALRSLGADAERGRQALAGATDLAPVLFSEALRTPGPETCRNALWLVPSLRFNEAFGPRRSAAGRDFGGLWPGLFRFWLHGLAAAEGLAERALTLQEATSLWADFVPLGALAARYYDLPQLAPGPQALPAAAPLQGAVRALAEACVRNRRARRPLGALLRDACAGLATVAERVAWARALEGLLGELRFEPGGSRPEGA